MGLADWLGGVGRLGVAGRMLGCGLLAGLCWWGGWVVLTGWLGCAGRLVVFGLQAGWARLAVWLATWSRLAVWLAVLSIYKGAS